MYSQLSSFLDGVYLNIALTAILLGISTFQERPRLERDKKASLFFWLSRQRDLQIGGPVFRRIKRTPVNVFPPMKQDTVGEIPP